MTKRTYAGEMEWALSQISCANHDRNPNRYAQIQAAVKYGLDVAIARRRDHLADNGIKGLGACDPKEKPVREVEEDFWGRRFRTYSDWKKETYGA